MMFYVFEPLIKYKKLWISSCTTWDWALISNNFYASRLSKKSYQTFLVDRLIFHTNIHWFLLQNNLLKCIKIRNNKKFSVLFKWEVKHHNATHLNIKSSNFARLFSSSWTTFCFLVLSNIRTLRTYIVGGRKNTAQRKNKNSRSHNSYGISK